MDINYDTVDEYSDASMYDGNVDGISESVQKIFAGVLVGCIQRDNPRLNDKREAFRFCMPKFQARFMYNVFENEYAFLYSVIKKLRVKVFTMAQLDSLIDQNANEILHSPLIDMSKYANSFDNRVAMDEEKIEAFRYDIHELMNRLSNMYVSIDEFESSCEIYTEWYKDKLMLETTQIMSMIMSAKGYDNRLSRGRRVHLQGRDAAQRYYNDKMAIMRSLDEEDTIKSVVLNEEYYNEDMRKEAEHEDDSIIDFGIEEIDCVMGKLRRGNMIEFMGPPKGGKTTITQYLVDRCLEAGLNVAVWPLEGTKDEWISVLTSLTIRKDLDNGGMYVSKKNVLYRKYDDEFQRQAVLAAKARLMTDPNRGKLSFIQGSAYVEDFLDVIQNHYDTENPFDVIVMDSPVNILSRNGGKSKVERISEAYMSLKNFVANKMKIKPLCIVTAQLKQSVIDYIRANPTETLDVTAGGESAETIRTPDEVLGLFSTKQERQQGMMKVYSVASRHNENFDDFYIGCQLGCGYFYSKPELNE